MQRDGHGRDDERHQGNAEQVLRHDAGLLRIAGAILDGQFRREIG